MMTRMRASGRPTRDAFLAPFVAAGYTPVEPPILQPADVFVDLSGEELARRLYLTSDAEGRELCLRPELTIPVCLAHVAGGDPARRAEYCYHGPAFRFRPGGMGEFLQAGVESIGRADWDVADAEILAMALHCAARNGLNRPRVRIGDTGLFRAVLDALDLPPAWRRRLARDFGRSDAFDLKAPAQGGSAGLVTALAGVDRKAARGLVEDLLAIGGLTTVGGRTVAEITDRFLEQAELADSSAEAGERLALLRRFAALSGRPSEVMAEARRLTGHLGAGVAAALKAFERRNEALRAAGVPNDILHVDAGFGRRLDYYSGFVFELHDPARPELPQVIGGGRYDGMLAFLGAPGPVPAVGFSVWVERLPNWGDA